MRDKNSVVTGWSVSRDKSSRFALTLLFVLSLFLTAQAQGGATVSGHVTDERGANVAGAEVRLRTRSGMQLFGRTDQEGVYKFTGLGPGEYILEVTAQGFAANTSEALPVERGQSVKQAFQRSLASSTLCRARAPAVRVLKPASKAGASLSSANGCKAQAASAVAPDTASA